MHYLDQQGNYYTGEQAPGGIAISPRPSIAYALKADWKSHLPDVWELSLSSAVAPKKASLFADCEAALATILSLYPAGERQTWSDKTPLAAAWLALSGAEKTAAKSNPTYTTLFAEATGKILITNAGDITSVTDLCTRITTNKILFGAYAGAVLNIKTVALSALNAATTEEEVNAVTWDFSTVTIESIMEALGL